jgi:hypothetical protein
MDRLLIVPSIRGESKLNNLELDIDELAREQIPNFGQDETSHQVESEHCVFPKQLDGCTICLTNHPH